MIIAHVMFRNHKILIAGLVSVFFIESCKKEEAISNTPSLKFVSMNPNPSIKYQDEVKIVVECTDGDGDLGENTPDVKNLFVTDTRNNVTSEFRISQLAPDNSKIIIRGNLDINLPPQGFVDDNNTTETTTFRIFVKDRAGNISNTIETSTLTINK